MENIKTTEIKRLHLDIPVREIHGIGISKINHWVTLKPSNDEDQYILYTTKDFPIKNEVFIVNLKTNSVFESDQD